MTSIPDNEAEYWLLDRNGVPAALVDADQIERDGKRLAFGMASKAGDADAAYELLVETLRTLPVEHLNFVLGAALRITHEAILTPLLLGSGQPGLTMMAAIRHTLDVDQTSS